MLGSDVAPDWQQALSGTEPLLAGLTAFLEAESHAGRPSLPPSSDVLRAFTRPLADVKVLIVGQDPYPTPGHATGLAFSVPHGTSPLPPSLRNIFREYHSDLGLPSPTSGDLSPWADQGVLLLNRVLTVAAGEIGSHRGRGWEEFTLRAIDAVVARGMPFVAILWGRAAASVQPRLAGAPVITSAHPSPLSAAKGFFGSRPFSRANAHLLSLGVESIDWRLP